MLLTKLIVIKTIVFGQEAVYMNLCRYLLSQMALIPNITAIPPVNLISVKTREHLQKKAKRPATVLNLPLGGLIEKTNRLLI